MQHQAVVQLSIPASAKKVWQWLTQPELVKQYFFGTDLVTDWAIGSPIYWRGEWEGQAYEDKGTVLQFQPEQHLQFDYLSSWSQLEDKPENYQLISYHLEETNGTTLLRITQEKIPTEEQKAHSEDNWKSIFGVMKEMIQQT